MADFTRNPVAFQGELGAFSHSAAAKLVGGKARFLPCGSFKEVFGALSRGAAGAAVVPIENTLHGSIHEVYDLLVHSDVPIAGETTLRISHHLLALPGIKFNDIRQALSHPVALNQCRRFFEHHRRIEPVAFYDTAGSVKALGEQGAQVAAVASEEAASIYGARILKRNIEDYPQNFTRFFLLTKQLLRKKKRTGVWKTSIVFSTRNCPGALFRAMACFALRDLNLTKIESRPLEKRPWEYLFYLDLIGAETDNNVARALDHLREMTTLLKVLGSYQSTP
jgi:prephenate dehydratase